MNTEAPTARAGQGSKRGWPVPGVRGAARTGPRRRRCDARELADLGQAVAGEQAVFPAAPGPRQHSWCRSRQGRAPGACSRRVTKADSWPAPPIAVLTHRGSRTGGQLPPAKSVSTLRQARPPGHSGRRVGWALPARGCRAAKSGRVPLRPTRALPRSSSRASHPGGCLAMQTAAAALAGLGAGGAGPRPGSAAAARARSRNMRTGRLESFRRCPGFPTGPRAGRGPARGSRARRGEPGSAGSGAARLRR